jgi:hypothetical protein
MVACGARTPLELGDTTNTDGGAPSGDDSSPSIIPTKFGYVVALASNGDAQTMATAVFYSGLVDPACAFIGALGTCSVVACPPGGSGAPSENVGVIDAIASDDGGTTQISYFGQSPTGFYENSVFPSEVSENATIVFVGHGLNDVPRFSVSATIPGVGVLTSPSLDTSPTIDTSQDLPITWSAVPVGDAVFTIAADGQAADTTMLVCFFDGTTGTGVVPRASLAQIAAAARNGGAEIGMLMMTRATTTAGEWTVNAIASVGLEERVVMATLK